MSGAARPLAVFGAALVALFAAGTVVGRAVDPDAPGASDAPVHGAEAADAGHQAAQPTHGATAGDGVRGLAVSSNGVRLVLAPATRRAGSRAPLEFQIVDAGGRVVRDMEVTHERRMHLIVVRRDLTVFQHLHPTQRADGTWAVPLSLEQPGAYRVFADWA